MGLVRRAPLIALAGAAIMLALSIFIVMPGGTPGLFALSVGVTELWPLVAFLDLVALIGCLSKRGKIVRMAASCAAIALACSLTPLLAYVAHGPRVPFHVLLSPPPRTADVIVTSIQSPRALVYRLPRVRTARPVVVAIYGGAWQRGSPNNDEALNRAIASAGFCVIAIDYAHAPGARWPAQRLDALTALAWVRRHARDFGGDAGRISLLGHSSGAQVALSVAAVRPRGVVSVVVYESPVDLRLGYLFPVQPDIIHARDIMSALCGGPPDQKAACYRDASPRYEVRRGMPPVLMVVASRDHVVNLAYESVLRTTLQRSGVAVSYVELPWADHAFETVAYGWHGRIAMWYVLRFLAGTNHTQS
ncbi:MAG: alpha/beta hydrolase [Candidatus Eremiobacteraeota bacterium]|nr:alpha/beta hydrolase [Candidatus Eremiobacteraeota bacterium]